MLTLMVARVKRSVLLFLKAGCLYPCCGLNPLISNITLQRRRGEFLNLSTEFMLDDHILYSHDLSD